MTAPADITVKADPGGCTATLKLNDPIDAEVDKCDSGCTWFVDRYPSAVFERDTTTYAPDSTLRQGVDLADSLANRPPAFSSPFYNWQGYRRSVNLPQGAALAADVSIPSAWAGLERVASLWGQTADAAGFITGYPVLAFNGAVDEMGTPTPKFRAFVQDIDGDNSNGFQAGWVDLLTLTVGDLDRWFRFEVELTEGLYPDFIFRVTDLSTDTVVASHTDSGTFDSLAFTDLFLQMFNFGETHETRCDDVSVGPDGPTARRPDGPTVDDCIANVNGYVRSDDPALTLADPFPSGTTTVTWTVEDACGRITTAEQLVTVEAVNQFDYAVEMDDPAGSFSLPMTRCLIFEFAEDGCGSTISVQAEVLFIDAGGTALAVGSIDIPCGDYECVRVIDARHTLASIDADDFVIVPGTAYTAGWDDAGERLVNGNLNGDGFVDILDFGVFVGEFGSMDCVAGGSTCADAFPHADINGDGAVDSIEFSFISSAFFEIGAPPCCALPAMGGAGGPVRGPQVDPRDPRATVQPGPVRSISLRDLRRRGLGHLEIADLNRDGRLDPLDMAAFLDGARP